MRPLICHLPEITLRSWTLLSTLHHLILLYLALLYLDRPQRPDSHIMASLNNLSAHFFGFGQNYYSAVRVPHTSRMDLKILLALAIIVIFSDRIRHSTYLVVSLVQLEDLDAANSISWYCFAFLGDLRPVKYWSLMRRLSQKLQASQRWWNPDAYLT